MGFSFIYRYSQLFNVVSSYHTADAPTASGFVPDPMNYVRIYGRNRFVIRARNSSRLAGRGEGKNVVFNVFPPRKVQGC